MSRDGDGVTLVTGATGFVGRAVCAELARRQYAVRSIVRVHRVSDSVSGAELSDRVQLDDIGPATDWSGAIDEVKAVVHPPPGCMSCTTARRTRWRHFAGSMWLAP